jgi:dTDP-4-dehydrorhamnose reductase
MKALVTGGGGQLGVALTAAAPAGWRVTSLARDGLDIADEQAVRTVVENLRPDLILNAAAYTAVDRAESEPDVAFRINCDGAHCLALAAEAVGARMVHVSTDYVFDGRSGRPYRPDDAPNPLNVYGASKLAGEKAVALASPSALIVRTAWVYAAGHANFVNTMLNLMRRGADLRVVADQIGTPTSCPTLAASLWALAGAKASGVFHVTDAGVASWYDFACAIAEEAVSLGLLESAPPVTPVNSAERPSPTVRPAFGVLDKSETWRVLGAAAPHWRQSLREVLKTLGT